MSISGVVSGALLSVSYNRSGAKCRPTLQVPQGWNRHDENSDICHHVEGCVGKKKCRFIDALTQDRLVPGALDRCAHEDRESGKGDTDGDHESDSREDHSSSNRQGAIKREIRELDEEMREVEGDLKILVIR